MPVLTGTLEDVTGQPAAGVRSVMVRATTERVSAASGSVLVTTAPVAVTSAGSLSVELEPGPAVLIVDGGSLFHDTYRMVVTSDMTLLSEAIANAGGQVSPWQEAVLVQLLADARTAASDAEASAAAAAADAQVVGSAAQDMSAQVAAAEGHATAAAGSAQDAASSAGAAASSASAAAGSATDAAGHASDAAGAVVDARAARDAAEGHASSAAGSASSASGSAVEAGGHADRAEAAANEFGLTASSSTLAPGSQATVTVSGDGPAYQVAFGIPQGAKGDKGDQGPQGVQGVQGPKGEKGDTGEQGVQGIRGEKGDPGPKGDTGDAGPKGDRGDDGEVSQAMLDAAVGQRALIDGAPVEYDSLGKLVSALIAGELGGSTDGIAVGGVLEGVEVPPPSAGPLGVAVGYGSQAGEGSAAIGMSASAAGDYSAAIGTAASAAGEGSTAIGMSASAAGMGSTAVGAQTSAAGMGSAAIGMSASAPDPWTIAIGAHPDSGMSHEVHIPGTLVLYSPDGAMWALTVGNDGTLSTSPWTPPNV